MHRAEPLARHSTFRIGGPADLLCVPETRKDLISIMRWVTEYEVPWVALGNGSNILFSDKGFRGVVIKIRGAGPVSGTLWDIERDGNRVHAGAGISLARLARFCAGVGLSGMEWGTGIPGVVGGSIRGNAGAHGWEMGDVVESVEAAMPSGEMVTLSGQALGFSYRHSQLDPAALITCATFVMQPGDPDVIRKRIQEYTDSRKRTQPSADQSAGCMFKNPPGDSAGRLIDISGCKGLQVGGAVVSELHANFIVNLDGQATASDTLNLIDQIRTRVHENTGVTLDLEVRVMKSEGV